MVEDARQQLLICYRALINYAFSEQIDFRWYQGLDGSLPKHKNAKDIENTNGLSKHKSTQICITFSHSNESIHSENKVLPNLEFESPNPRELLNYLTKRWRYGTSVRHWTGALLIINTLWNVHNSVLYTGITYPKE